MTSDKSFIFLVLVRRMDANESLENRNSSAIAR